MQVSSRDANGGVSLGCDIQETATTPFVMNDIPNLWAQYESDAGVTIVSGNDVSAWEDQSPNNNDLILGNGPTNYVQRVVGVTDTGKDAIANKQTLTNWGSLYTTDNFNANEITICLVLRQKSTLPLFSGVVTSLNLVLRRNGTNAGYNLQPHGGGGITLAVSDNEFHMLTVKISASSMYMQDGLSSFASDAAFFTPQNDALHLFGSSADLEIAAMSVFERFITSDEQALLFQYYNLKYIQS